MKTITKLDNNTVQITEETTVINTTTNNFTYEALVGSRDSLVQQKADADAVFDAQIAGAQALIDEADGLGVMPLV